MLTNYFKVAFRNLVRDKFYSFIKIAGLSIGLTVCVLILLYTKDEVTYDKFHINGSRIYRIVQNFKFGEAEQAIAVTNAVMAETFAREELKTTFVLRAGWSPSKKTTMSSLIHRFA